MSDDSEAPPLSAAGPANEQDGFNPRGGDEAKPEISIGCVSDWRPVIWLRRALHAEYAQ